MRTRKNSVFGHFSCSEKFYEILKNDEERARVSFHFRDTFPIKHILPAKVFLLNSPKLREAWSQQHYENDKPNNYVTCEM